MITRFDVRPCRTAVMSRAKMIRAPLHIPASSRKPKSRVEPE
jgi:hypothetical protein